MNSHRSSSAAICAAVVVAAAVATAFLQYLMPASFDNAPQVNHAGVAQFSDALFGRRWPALSTMAFVWTFRALLTVMWLAYALMLRSLLADPRPRRWALPLVVTSAVAIAVIFPPSLSGDLYAYAGWGRMVVFHGGNPYVDTLASLAAAGDAAARVNPVPAPSNHGPLWVLVVSAVVWLAPTADPFLQVLTLKLLAAAAVVTAALSARTLGAETASGGRDLPLAAIGLNPLLLVEGPGSGHNDMFMVALMLAGFASHTAGRKWLGYLLVGSSAAVKYITISVIPWLLLREYRSERAAREWRAIALAAVLSVLPAILSYAVLWRGVQTFQGVLAVYDQRVRAIEQDRVEIVSRSHAGGVVVRGLLLAVVYLGLTALVVRDGRLDTLMSAWAVFVAAVIWIVMPVIFSWYFVWPVATSLTSWTAAGRRVSLVCAILAAVMLYHYTVPFVR